MEESLLPESIDRRTSKPRGTTVEVQMRPTGRPFVQRKEKKKKKKKMAIILGRGNVTAAGSTVEEKVMLWKNTNIGEENSQDKERGDGDISRSEGEETTSMTVIPQLKFEDAPETEQFAAVTLGIHLAGAYFKHPGQRWKGSVCTGPGRDGHVPPTESTTERDLAKSTSLMRNGSTAGKKDLTTTRRTTTTTRIVEEQKSTAKITTTGDELVTTGKRLVTTATVLTTVLPTTQSSKSTTTSPSTSEDITTSPAMQTTTVAVTTTPKSSTATLPTTPPVTTTAAVTMTAAVRTTEDNEIVPITERPEYIWRVTGHSTCQVTCGRGIRMEYAYCVNREDAIVADNLCNPQTKPEVIPRTCVNENVKLGGKLVRGVAALFHVESGVRFRTVSCWRMERSGEDVWQPDTNCHPVEREATMEECATEACILEWRVGDWSSCSAECGEGHQSRVVQCSVANSSRGHCDRLQRPADRRVCEGTNCHSRWGTSQWPTCTGGCQTQVRRVNCYSPTNSIQLDVNCNHQRKPLSVSLCGSGSCSAQWIAQTWNQDNCGNCQRGFRAREVSCQGSRTGRWFNMMKADAVTFKCQSRGLPVTFPPAVALCSPIRLACSPDGTRQSGPRYLSINTYSGMRPGFPECRCSVTCGGGQKRRKVRCYQNGAPSHRCDRNSMPPAVHSCSLGDCPVREVCTDNATVKCNVIKQANLCTYKYYAQNCCRTCTR
ncbi:putative ADAMTS-like protein 2 isoform X2 [Apostichopus japonicus]|uniref:Putative ADAMTS-like protein 2 isoform X2 n=1 Tax=Stichopus japonicus TaxID=307972 RepID=A0A2G8KBP8_STIJA|nr:putative ADAMTS-like protein 2 isoform X2 [Apostichopus japonicus]